MHEIHGTFHNYQIKKWSFGAEILHENKNTVDCECEKAEILLDLNIEENWYKNSVIFWNLNYFGHIQQHSGLERTVMKAFAIVTTPL